VKAAQAIRPGDAMNIPIGPDEYVVRVRALSVRHRKPRRFTAKLTRVMIRQ
jgi:ribosomal 50S subunit-recycling heat shock protein